MTIVKFTPLTEIRSELRAYGVIWVPIYAYLFSFVSENEVGEYENVIALVFAILLHAGLYISTKWSVKSRCLLDMRRSSSFSDCSFTHLTDGGIYAVRKDSYGRRYIEKDCLRMYLNEGSGLFEKSVLPINKSLAYYCESSGLSATDGAISGESTMDIPVPHFWDLFKARAIEPFFVFQLFCVLLWLLDEYWNYALMTLGMLVLLESQMVHRSISDMKEIASVKPPIVTLSVFRDKKWSITDSRYIVPSDLVALGPSQTVPCDMLLLRSSACLVNEELLTGESVPVLKHALAKGEDRCLDLDGTDRNCVLFAGSVLLAVTQSALPPNSVVGFVLRTGFETAQGSLIVSILNSENRVNASSAEAYRFILVLVCVALLAASWVVYEGFYTRSQFKLFLSVSHILTSVIPPEFPITMSLTVTLSLGHLMRQKIFCTEPFRIPIAGKITDCCFDKTGTLTSSEMKFHSCTNSIYGKRILGICHSLTRISKDSSLVGDPIELAGFNEFSNQQEFGKYTVKTRFPFDANLQRMSIHVVSNGTETLLMKGSPESVKRCLAHVPEDYDAQSDALAAQGLRVLALAYREGKMHFPDRTAAESNCVFAGFASFSYTIKPGTVATIAALHAAGLRCVMITGDHALTATHVAKSVGISTNNLHVGDPSEAIRAGTAKDITVWARTTPLDKKNIVAALSKLGRVCLFCGDGTNDVSALKEAAVGVAIMASASAASIAAPFVYRGDAIRCVTLLIRSGRATLALVMQMYKTLAVNSLITAFTISGRVKLGDSQIVAESLLMSILSFMMSRPKPIANSIDSRPPIVSVFAGSVVCTIFFQALLHVSLIVIGQWNEPVGEWDEKFAPSLTNTVLFIQLFASHYVSCVVNYEGPPSLPAIRVNKPLRNVTIFVLFVLVLLATDLMPTAISEGLFELVPIEPVRASIVLLVAAHIGGGWLIAFGIRHMWERR